MCSEPLPKEFEKTSDVLPFTKYGVSTLEEFKNAEETVHHLEWLKKVGLTNEEIKLYQDDVAGLLDQRQNIESGVLSSQLDAIMKKIRDFQDKTESSDQNDNQPSTSSKQTETVDILQRIQKRPAKFYPEGHPMHEIKDMEENLFGHLKDESIISITKRRKILRRLERKKERILAQGIEIDTVQNVSMPPKPGSLWDVKEVPDRKPETSKGSQIIGPKKPTMYTIKDNKIMRLEPVQLEEQQDEYEAVDIVMPVNAAEEQLLEGTKMCVDDLKKIERFKDYEPGIPSKVLYLKNIAPTVSPEQLSLLFNQFALDNGGAVDVRYLAGRMRGQAFVSFTKEDVCIQALEEVNGTILCGRPIVAHFGRNTNRVHDR